MSNNVILDVKDLRISFRTGNGKVQAVRDIGFQLNKGETLAIVGESGSGKSVTSRAILGILAGNAIVESGSILYAGQDLLRGWSEETFHKIRGDRISMIFQDPLSSLNPIVKIGKQLTEAMLLKNKAGRKRARKEFNGTLKELEKNIVSALCEKGENEEEAEKRIKEKCRILDSFCIESIKIENPYLQSVSSLEEALEDIEHILLMNEKKQKTDYRKKIKKIVKSVNQSFNAFSVDKSVSESYTRVLSEEAGYCKKELSKNAEKALKSLTETLSEAKEKETPNFFRIGYCALKNKEIYSENKNYSSDEIKRINEESLHKLNEEFMDGFLKDVSQGLEYSEKSSIKEKANVIEIINNNIMFFEQENPDKEKIYHSIKEISESVNRSIDKLNVTAKDSQAMTFESSLKDAADRYFNGVKNNPKEKARFDRQNGKFCRLSEKGKTPDWKVTPPAVIDLKVAKDNMLTVIRSIKEKYEKDIEKTNGNYEEKSIALIDFFKEKATQVVTKVTKKSAKLKAIKLMEEVGIAEPEKRYNQYPFEFSGGMRQRIVIAIALSANPDILICDEPTTALDVTIQSQILELINRLKKERHLSVIFITHDLGVVANMADRVAVMYAGKIVEYGTSDDIFYRPAHPYTWALLSSMPDLDTADVLEAIPGTPPNMIYPPKGDAFANRNKYALDIDFEMQPPMFEISDTHKAATWLLHPYAPKVEMPKTVIDRINRMKREAGIE